MKPIYYGWNVVAYAAMCSMIVVGSTLSSFGLYVVPVSEEMNLSRADMNTALMLLNLGGAFAAPLTGWLTDRFPARRLLILGGAGAAVGFAVLSVSQSVIFSALVIGMFITLADALGTRPSSALVVRWFNNRRGRALTFGAFGLSLASILVAPTVGVLIEKFTWRGSLLITGMAIGAIIIVPAIFLRVKPTPEEMAFENIAPEDGGPDGATGLRPMSFRQLIKVPQFWVIALGIALPFAVSQAVMVSMIPMAVEHGISTAQAALLVSVSGLMAISSKVVLSFFADRVDRSLLLAGICCVAAVENVILFAVASKAPFEILIACAVIQGFTSGMLMPLWNALVADRFGPRSFATVTGAMYPITLIWCALLVRLAGEIFDRTGSYHGAFATFLVLQIVAAILLFCVRFTKPTLPVLNGRIGVRAESAV